MQFQKTKTNKKRKTHKKSILYQKKGTCYLCVRLHGDYRYHGILHEHHIYGGPNRAISEANGFKVKLCIGHHETGEEAVHRNHGTMRILQEDCQREYEKDHTREEFMALVGRNYL